MDSNINTFIAELLHIFGKDSDIPFRRRMESSVVGYRATILKQEFDKNGRFPSGNLESICLPIQQANAIDCCISEDIDCKVMRTKDKIPKGIRTNRNPDPFVSVSSGNNEIGYTFIQPEELNDIIVGTKFISKSLYYSYFNDYIFTFNSENERINIRDAFANPFELFELRNCHGKPCLNVFNIDEDMKRTIKVMILEEFGLTKQLTKDNQIRLTDEQL